MGLFRQEHWSGLPFPPPGDLKQFILTYSFFCSLLSYELGLAWYVLNQVNIDIHCIFFSTAIVSQHNKYNTLPSNLVSTESTPLMPQKHYYWGPFFSFSSSLTWKACSSKREKIPREHVAMQRWWVTTGSVWPAACPQQCRRKWSPRQRRDCRCRATGVTDHVHNKQVCVPINLIYGYCSLNFISFSCVMKYTLFKFF